MEDADGLLSAKDAEALAAHIARTPEMRYLRGIYAALVAQNQILGDVRDRLGGQSTSDGAAGDVEVGVAPDLHTPVVAPVVAEPPAVEPDPESEPEPEAVELREPQQPKTTRPAKRAAGKKGPR